MLTIPSYDNNVRLSALLQHPSWPSPANQPILFRRMASKEADTEKKTRKDQFSEKKSSSRIWAEAWPVMARKLWKPAPESHLRELELGFLVASWCTRWVRTTFFSLCPHHTNNAVNKSQKHQEWKILGNPEYQTQGCGVKSAYATSVLSCLLSRMM